MTTSQEAVLAVLEKYGPLPDHALVPLCQHVSSLRLSSSGIRSRRAELADLGKVQATGETIKMPSGRFAHVWEAV
jgi:hypothetical protein